MLLLDDRGDSLKWTTLVPNTDRKDHFSARWAVNIAITPSNILVLVGGLDEKGAPLSDVWISFNGSEWNLVNAHIGWSTRYDFSLAYFNHMLVIAGGGAGGYSPDEPSGTLTNEIWISSDLGKSWRNYSGEHESIIPPWRGRNDFGMVVIPGGDYSPDRLVIAGGALNYTSNTLSCEVWSTTNVTDPTAWRISSRRLDPHDKCGAFEARDDFGMTVFHKRIFLAGGIEENGKILYTCF